MGQLVFAYGSLVAAAPAGLAEHRLVGHVRTWGVAMDNRVDLPGYKYYTDETDGTRPDCAVAFLDIEAAAGEVNGVLIETTAEALGLLDDRERSYTRVPVTRHVRPAPPGEVFAYVGTAEARQRQAASVAEGTCLVDAHYVDRVRAGFAALGQAPLDRFDATTPSPPCPVRRLRHHELA